MSQRVRVLSSLEDLSYLLRHPEAERLCRDVVAAQTEHWDFELGALRQFADDALRLGEALLAYAVMARLAEGYEAFLLIEEFRDALDLLALACGDAPLSESSSQTASEHFAQLIWHSEKNRRFQELDGMQIFFETPLDVATHCPIKGTFNAIVQHTPDPSSIADVCCRILCGVALLRQFASEQGLTLDGALIAEGKAADSLRRVWFDLDEASLEGISEAFARFTAMDVSHVYGL